MTASFQIQEQGFDHQDQMPNVPAPEDIPSYSDFIKQNQHFLPENMRNKFLAERPIEIRPIEQYNWVDPKPAPAVCNMWIKANGNMPDDLRIHMYMLAYTSDFHFLPTALYPHGVSHWHPNFQIATIDHAMWFHRPFRFDDWLLYSMQSPSASNGRGLVRGQIFDRQGRLVASTIQEGVIRQR